MHVKGREVVGTCVASELCDFFLRVSQRDAKGGRVEDGGKQAGNRKAFREPTQQHRPTQNTAEAEKDAQEHTPRNRDQPKQNKQPHTAETRTNQAPKATLVSFYVRMNSCATFQGLFSVHVCWMGGARMISYCVLHLSGQAFHWPAVIAKQLTQPQQASYSLQRSQPVPCNDGQCSLL
jgi:membrane glycosyltransferase